MDKRQIAQLQSQRIGKSETQRLFIENALDNGKRVLKASKDKTEILTRKKHLTCIEILKPEKYTGLGVTFIDLDWIDLDVL